MNFGSPFDSYKPLFFTEADDDNNQDQQAADNNDNQNNNADAGNNQENTDNNQQDNNENQDDSFDIDTNFDNSGDNDNSGDDAGDQSSTTSSGDMEKEPVTGEANVDTPAKKRDREIFNTLSPEEQKLKTAKLKELYMTLYTRCEQIVEKYDSLGIEYENLIDPIRNSLKAIYNLKDSISYYLLYLFDSKSYIENDIMFNRMLTIMNQIRIVTKDMRNSHKEEIESMKNNSPLKINDIDK